MRPYLAWLQAAGIPFALAQPSEQHDDAMGPPEGEAGHADHATASLMLVLRGPGFVRPGSIVWEPGCGTGSLSIEAARRGAQTVRGSDVEPHLVDVARHAAAMAGVDAEFSVGAFLDPYPAEERPDLMIANLPQKPGPGGPAGEELFRVLIAQAIDRLAPGARVLFTLHTFVAASLLAAWAPAFSLTLLAWKRRHLAPGEFVAPGGLVHEGAVYGGVWLAVRQ